MKQFQDAFSSYPWLLPLLAGALLLGIVIAVVIVMVLKKREERRMRPFEVLDAEEPVSQIPGNAAHPVSLESDDEDRTRHLFDYPDTDLKTYRLQLLDLNVPGQVYQVNLTDRVVIGRKNSCTICIPDSTLSGEHCEITLKNGKMYLRDLNSTNGTFLNGNQNRVAEEVLPSGSVIEMGAVRLKAELSILQL